MVENDLANRLVKKIKLEKENISEWSKDDIEELKNMLDNVIPLIRFSQITSTEFHEKIEPYKKIVDKELYEEIIQIYHNN
jgi:hypothetical protein